MDDTEKAEVWTEFRDLVNMTPKQLQDWLETDESKAVGFKGDDGGESVGHQSGKKIIEIKNTKKADLSDDQWTHMRKVVGYIKRHLAQHPHGDIENTPWRFSLMNWGHDPLKS